MKNAGSDDTRPASDREGGVERRRLLQGGLPAGAALIAGRATAQAGGLDPSRRTGRTTNMQALGR